MNSPSAVASMRIGKHSLLMLLLMICVCQSPVIAVSRRRPTRISLSVRSAIFAGELVCRPVKGVLRYCMIEARVVSGRIMLENVMAELRGSDQLRRAYLSR